MKKPPRLAVSLLSRSVPDAVREEIEGDLVEEYRSRGRSRLWFWKQAISVAWSYTRTRTTRPRRRRARQPEGFLHGVRASFRALRRRPGFSAAVLGLLTVAVSVNAAMFYWIDGIWNRPLPYDAPERLVRLFHTREGVRQSLSPPNFFELVEEQRVFDSLAAFWSPSLTLTGEGEPERLLGATVSYSFFHVLGVPPGLGRGFTREDDLPGAAPVVVLGHGLFQRRFGGDPAVIGRDIVLDGMAVTVIGVAPETLSFPAVGTELWVPLRLPRDRPDQGGTSYRGFRILDVVGRRKAGVTLEEARAGLGPFSQRLAREHPASNVGFTLEVEDFREVELASLRAPLFFLWGAVVLFLLIVCANVSGLWIARLASRERELAIRLALGASRARLVRELSGEGIILSFLGVAFGCLAGRFLVSAVAPFGFAMPEPVEPGFRLLLFVSSLFAAVTLAFIAAPAIVAPRGQVPGALRAGGRVEGGKAQAGARRTLVVFEMALAATLLVSAMLLLKSFRALEGVERGYREDGVYFASVELPFGKYVESHRRAAFFEELLSRVRLAPGVERASVSLGLPLDPRADFFVTRSPYSVEGAPEPLSGLKPEAALHVVSPDLFETLGVSLVTGRSFDSRDVRSAPPVVVVSQSFAERAWPGRDPLGKRLTHDLVLLPDDANEGRVVIGVVRDFHYYAVDREAEPSMFVPHSQSPWPQMHLLIRTSRGGVFLHDVVRDALREMDAEIPLEPFRELAAVTEGVIAPARLRARLLTAFAAAAALLAALGLYGVMAFSVARRTREIALRVALGARRTEVLRLVFGQALGLAMVGALFGLTGALLSARFLSSLLFGVSALDPWTYGSMFLALLALSLLASFVPARRATAVDPIVALRAE